MIKNRIYLISAIIVPFILGNLTSCSSDFDPSGKFWWTFIGFPLLGIAYIFGGAILSLITPKRNDSDKDTPEPVSAIIIGVVVMFIIYGIYKAIS